MAVPALPPPLVPLLLLLLLLPPPPPPPLPNDGNTDMGNSKLTNE